MQRTMTWVAALLFLGWLTLGYFYMSQRQAWQTAQTANQKRIDSLQGQLDKAKKSLAVAAPAHSPESLKPAAPAATNRGRKPGQISDILKEHPELGTLYAKEIRRTLYTIYGKGLETLNLPPDQLSKLKDLLVERQMSVVDAVQVALGEGLAPGTLAWAEAIKQANQTGGAAIAAVLGPNAEATLTQLQSQTAELQTQAYLQTRVASISSEFADVGAPLSADQSSGLTQAMLDNIYWQGKDASARPTNYNEVDPTSGLSPHDVLNMNSASQVLSPAQMQVFQTYEAENEQILALAKQYNVPPGLLGYR